MREHVPVESDKSYGFEAASDEEVPAAGNDSLKENVKVAIA